jgi:hypothetical protein
MAARQVRNMTRVDDSEQVIRAAAELALRPHVADLELADALWRAERAAPGSLMRVVALSGLGRRKAYYLIAIWRRFVDLPVERAWLARIGWTKLAIIARQVPAGEEHAALEIACTTTTRELPRVLKGGRRDRPKRHSVLLRLSPTQYRVLAQTLTQFGAQTPKTGRGLVGKERALIRALGAIPLAQRVGPRPTGD